MEEKQWAMIRTPELRAIRATTKKSPPRALQNECARAVVVVHAMTEDLVDEWATAGWYDLVQLTHVGFSGTQR
ncbi:hypothetical protein Y032_0295g1652 [Ancylostoma ceylanicum]|uniref:Uncharacterized protein n=1 Tax=Ancylostoma ceylanicum TaxID=53326 RepID=A0A016S4P8_9BILA|nr:hypothetical protein Y032_0295g1652 [Ancylostoma ceylanicum]